MSVLPEEALLIPMVWFHLAVLAVPTLILTAKLLRDEWLDASHRFEARRPARLLRFPRPTPV